MNTASDPRDQLRQAFTDTARRHPPVDVDELWHTTRERLDSEQTGRTRGRRKQTAVVAGVAAATALVVGVGIGLYADRDSPSGPATSPPEESTSTEPQTRTVRGPVSGEWACEDRIVQDKGGKALYGVIGPIEPRQIPPPAIEAGVARFDADVEDRTAINRFGDSSGNLTAVSEYRRGSGGWILVRHESCDLSDDVATDTERPEQLMVRQAPLGNGGLAGDDTRVVDTRPYVTHYGTVGTQELEVSMESCESPPLCAVVVADQPAQAVSMVNGIDGARPRCGRFSYLGYRFVDDRVCVLLSTKPVRSVLGLGRDGETVEFERVRPEGWPSRPELWMAIAEGPVDYTTTTFTDGSTL